MLYKKRRAAIRALRPVNGALGSKAAATLDGVLVADEDEDEPPPVADGFVTGLAFPVMQVLTPLMTPLS